MFNRIYIKIIENSKYGNPLFWGVNVFVFKFPLYLNDGFYFNYYF